MSTKYVQFAKNYYFLAISYVLCGILSKSDFSGMTIGRFANSEVDSVGNYQSALSRAENRIRCIDAFNRYKARGFHSAHRDR